MKTYNCLIVDDESLAQDLIETHLTKIPNIQIVAKCHTAMEASQVLNENSIDIMFLDIEMPDLSGIEFLRTLNNAPYTILTTAYSEYSLESYELNVVDYLLKPIRFERFFKSINKVFKLLNVGQTSSTELQNQKDEDDFIFVKSDYKSIKIQFKDIVFVESMQKYVKFHLVNKEVTTLMSLSSLTEILPPSDFFKCQKSFIVNLHKIEVIDGNQLIMDNKNIVPISKNLKQELLIKIDKFKLL